MMKEDKETIPTTSERGEPAATLPLEGLPKHTPTPYHIRDAANLKFGANVLIDSGDENDTSTVKHVASVSNFALFMSHTQGQHEQHAETVATAHFILRACNSHGELLEALKGLLAPAHIEGCLWMADKRSPCQCGSADRINTAYSKARAAIAKAEPRTSSSTPPAKR